MSKPAHSIPKWLTQTGHLAHGLPAEKGQGVRVMLIDSALQAPHFLTSIYQHTALYYHLPSSPKTEQIPPALQASAHADASVSLLLGYGDQLQGLTPQAEVHLVPAIYPRNRQATIHAIHRALLLALELAINIVIMPFGTRYGYPRLQLLLETLADKGILLFAAAGNYGEQSFCYPALYPSVTSVSALDKQGNVLPFCAKHEYVDQYIPAENVPCIQQGRVHPMSGSSLAAVLAGGLAALSYKKNHS